jgi:predicted dehydrogenase
VSALERLGAVVVGTGFGARVHVPALRAAGFEVEALVGRDPERTARRAARLGVPRALTSLEEALALPGVDAVTVASPPASHAPASLAAIAARKHVICEKPFALNASEARRMLAAARAAGVVHLVGFEFRFAPERALAARAIAEGAIGEPRFATFASYVSLVADPAFQMPGWWWDPAQGGGWLLASGSHSVDQIRVWLGEIAELDAGLCLVSDRSGVAEDSFAVRFRTERGVEGVLQQTGGAFGPFAGMTRVAGTRGTVWTEGDAVWVADAAGARQLALPEDLRLPPPPGARGDHPAEVYRQIELPAYTRLCEHFRDAILGRAAPPPDPPGLRPYPATFADGLASTLVLERIRDVACPR